VPAGDNPQHRDAVVVLRQVRQGLARFRQKLEPLIKQLKGHLINAKGIEKALELYLNGHDLVTGKSLKGYGTSVSDFWINTDYPYDFDFSKLDKINLTDYFQISHE